LAVTVFIQVDRFRIVELHLWMIQIALTREQPSRPFLDLIFLCRNVGVRRAIATGSVQDVKVHADDIGDA